MKVVQHAPVLCEEVTTQLVQDKDGRYLDATFGCGGHTRALLSCLSAVGQVMALDRDPSVTAYLPTDARLTFQQGRFSECAHRLLANGYGGQFAGILVDCGVSSPQLDEAARGFSFMRDGPLDMRMDPHSGVSAAHWLAEAPEETIAHYLKLYADERYARRIARAIKLRQQEGPIETTFALAEIVRSVVPRGGQRLDPATRTFQALRMVVNEETEELATFLEAVLPLLRAGGRFVALTFHGVETRMVRHYIQRHTPGSEDLRHGKYGKAPPAPLARRLPKIKPSAAEVQQNARARSAMAFVMEKV